MQTQTASVTVPPGGISGKLQQIVFQIPSWPLWELFKFALPDSGPDALNPEKCHVVVTVCAKGKTIHDDPQGEPDATVSVSPPITQKPFYFGYFDGITNPFVRGLNSTSLDGGVVWFNIDPSDKPYVISAQKEGYEFSQTRIWCRPGFINAAPNQGPRVIKP